MFGPLNRFPYQADRSYTPPESPESAYRHLLSVMGLLNGPDDDEGLLSKVLVDNPARVYEFRD